MMGGDIFLSQAFAELVRHTLGKAPRVDEDQRGTVGVDKFDDAVVNLVPHFVGSDGAEWQAWDFDSEVEGALVADIDDDRMRARVLGISSGEEASHFFNRLLRSGKADAQGPPVRASRRSSDSER